MKKEIWVDHYEKCFKGENHDVTFGDLPKDLKNSDIVGIYREEPDDDNYGYTWLHIKRKRLETDEEAQDRIEKDNQLQLELKERRRQSFRKLYDEFKHEI
jgi:hypothetical protein